MDGVLHVDAKNVNFKGASSSNRRPYDNAFWNSWQTTGDSNLYRQTDNVVDKFIQRVELCPGSTWASRGKCEYQPATAWDNNNVTVRVYQGALSSAAPIYAYVVNAQGQANANGFRVGSTAQTIPPAAATNVRVVR
jgi:hypothetical protein